MFLARLYIIWKYILRAVLGICATVVVMGMLLFGLIQLPFAQTYLSTLAQNYFNERYTGELSIGSVAGWIPFSMQLDDISLVLSENEHHTADTLLAVQRIDIRVNPLDFFRRTISVQSLDISHPMVRLDLEYDGEVYRLERAFQRREQRDEERPPRLENLELFAPFLMIEHGQLLFEPRQPGISPDQREPLIRIDDIQFSAFAELSNVQRYVDVYFLYASIPSLSHRTLRVRGQLFNDNRFLELNAMRVELGNSVLGISGEASPVDVFAGNLSTQLRESRFMVQVDTAHIVASDLPVMQQWGLPLDAPLAMQVVADGTIDEVRFTTGRVTYGTSELEFVGDLQHIFDPERFRYDGFLRQLKLSRGDMVRLIPATRELTFQDWNLLTTSGRVYGSLDRTDADLQIATRRGTLRIEGDVQWMNDPDYQIQITTERLNVGQFTSLSLPRSNLNLSALVQGNGIRPETAHLTANVAMFNTTIGTFSFDELSIQGDYLAGSIDATLSWLKNGSSLQADVRYEYSDEPELQVSGYANAFNIRELLTTESLAPTELELAFDARIVSPGSESMTGQLSVDIHDGVINGVIAPPHQFYADYLELGSGERLFRFTSTLADAEVRGDVYAGRLREMFAYWQAYINERVVDEFAFTDDQEFPEEERTASTPVQVNVDAQFKDMSLLGLYFTDLPDVQVNAGVLMNIQADESRLVINGGVNATELRYNDIHAQNTIVQFSNSLQAGRRLQDFSTLNIEAQSERLSRRNVVLERFQTSLAMLNETATLRVSSSTEGEDAYRFALHAQAQLSDTTIAIVVNSFDLGSAFYGWSLERAATARLTEDRKFHIDELRLANREQLVEISGTYSSDLDDAMHYRFINLDLAQISTIIDGRSTFEGILDGAFSSQSLLREPAITGELFVDRFSLDGRLVGDVSLRSTFDATTDRFNTEIRLLTDPDKYESYLAENNGVGHDILITGWFQAPDQRGSAADTLYYFDVDMRQIDGWILVPVLPFIFTQAEGVASGSGVFTGNAADFYFNARFDVREIDVVPDFVFTNYRLSGEVLIDRHEGVSIRNVDVRDRQNGTGVLNGTVSFNDFQPERPFDLTLSMNRLQFLNSSFSNDVPFFGTVAGTGSVSLTGSNMAPFLRTLTPINTTSDSRLTIPLLAETAVEEQARFIEFVTSFEELFNPRPAEESQIEGPALRERTFVEIARLDLQFIAPPATTVQLLFDPLTGEVLNARGSGRIRITLEDEEFQMFGNFNVTSGEYTFVAGDVFVRRFQLRNGGNISWEGDPVNAQLNMTAAYRARPNIGMLTGSSLAQQSRIPVDLILEITGTIQNIENDFFFEFPNAVDVTQNATELALLNSEDQKLIQATSLLFTGGFLPVVAGGDGQFAELGTSLQSRAGQVGLSQLLSNQINTLLNSNLSNLDVDLNLTGFDQADLGIALRLFDDRLILRGESQFYTASETGAETMLGDLGVTYRINRNLSVEVFHRRDPTLRSIVGNQTQAESINGVGLEAQVQFNTWRELRQRWWGQIRRVFRASDLSSDDDRTLTASN